MKTILTFGVFDLLHIGHIRLFYRAKQLGDRLIVAVQSDECVAKYKPDAQCFYSFEQRKYMVQSIRYVDETVIYNDVDLDIQHINFDVFVLGEDQNHAGFPKAIKWCRKHGKEVYSLQRTPGISSTMIRSCTNRR